MAPMTRRSQANQGVAKKVHRKRAGQPPAAKRETSDSWELLDQEGLNGRQREDTPDDANAEDDMLTIDGPMDTQSAVGPLRDMADKVGYEVERFAEALDELLDALPIKSRSNKFDWATEAIKDFEKVIDAKVADTQRTIGKGRDMQARKEWIEQVGLSSLSSSAGERSLFKTSVSGDKRAKEVQEMRDLQQEAELWRLFKMMHLLRPFEEEAEHDKEDRKKKLEKMGPANRYTSEDELWERFELSNDVAVDRRKVKKWLEQTANMQASNFTDVIAELESKAGRGKGLWTSGWMHTREKIKGEKRLRGWPSNVDSNPPQIRRAGDNDLLATRLDPDAVARQQRVLEKPDAYFERAIWIVCWEMLRRGKSWQEICQWCEERREGWRASCLGAATDTADSGSSRLAWRRLCRLATQSGCSSDHEAAVFGLLGGDEDAAKKICRSVDDRIYAFYNSKLLRAFDSFVLSQCPNSPEARHIDANAIETTAQGAEATKSLLARLSKEPGTSEEMKQPMKVVQSYLLCDEIATLLNTVGIMVGETARAQGAEGVIFFRSQKSVNAEDQIGEREVALNPQTLRMVAHMSIIYRVLLQHPFEGDDLLEDDNVVVAYIQALRAKGKRDLIPMYASRLQEERCVLVLGRVLQDVTNGEEQGYMLKLMRKYDLDVIGVLTEQMDIAFTAAFADGSPSSKPLRILECTPETKLHPGQRIIVGFLSDGITQADEALVTALQWFQLYHGHWAVTFKSLTEALVRCLLHGNLPCARLIIDNFPSETISLRKSHQTLGVALNLFSDDSEAPPPASKHDQMTRDLMKRQARTYHELEQLVRAIEALGHWRDEEEKYISRAPKPSTVPISLKEAKKAVSAAMQPLLGGILMAPRDEQEADNLAFIRRTFIPEVVIGYNTVLHAAGNLITRDALLESMDLSVAIAEEGKGAVGGGGAVGEGKSGNGLAECFQQAGRMRELVNGFALTSKVMLVLKAEGKPWKARKDREGKELGIWEIGSREGGEEE